MDGRSRQPILAVVIVAAALALIVPTIAQAADANDTAQEVWVVSTRHAARAGRVASAEEKIRYWQLGADRHWNRMSAAQLLGDDRPIPTTVFVHGNCTNHNFAVRSGWYVYRRMKRDARGRPFRFVIWSWPSDRVARRYRQDARTKAGYSDVQAYYLANCLRQISLRAPVSLVGYSFGARVITGALHLFGGGRIAGRRLPDREDSEPAETRRQPIRAVLVAAALDSDWLMPGHRNGLALSQVERLLVTRNGHDRVLKWYPLMYGLGGPRAMGHAGPAGCRDAQKIELLDVSCSVGRDHAFAHYMRASALQRRLARYTFLDTRDADTIADAPDFPEPAAESQ